jgi:hypothetical protein
MMRAPLLVALLMLVGCSSPERGSMTIHAIAPTDDTFYRPPQPIWRFAITNTGGCDVVWHSSVEVRGGDDRDYSHAGGHIEWPQGVLGPRGNLITNMIVPAKAGSVWRACIEFWPISPQDLEKAQADADRFGLSVVEFSPLPQGRKGTYNDEWHH